MTLAAFWLFAPDEVYPVTRKHGRSAHLDLGGARGVAIREAVAHQVGLEVVDITPFGLAGSGGSSPMRLTMGRRSPLRVRQAVLPQHVRADRIYKLIRSMLYGRLEDERAFSNARRLAESRTTRCACSATPACRSWPRTASSRSRRARVHARHRVLRGQPRGR